MTHQTHTLFDEAHWHKRAEQALEIAEEAATMAEGMRDLEARRIMLALAEDYATRATYARVMERKARQTAERGSPSLER